MRALETSLFQTYASRFLGWSRGTKWVQSTLRALISSLYRLLVSRILSWRGGRIWVKISKPEVKVQSSRSEVKGQRSNFKALETPLFQPKQTHLGLVKKQCLAITWNIVFSTWINSNFGLDKGQKMSLKCNGITWNIASKSQLRLVKRQKMRSKFNARTGNIAVSTSS